MANGFKTFLMMAALTLLLVFLGTAIAGTTGAGIALLVAAASNFVAFFFGDRMVLSRYGASEVGPGDGSPVYDAVNALVAPAGLPMPKVFVIPQKSPNAFATGRSPSRASVAATSGLVDILDSDELAGVMAHELAHVKHRDILTGTVAATLVGAISVLSQMGRYSGAGVGQGGARRNPIVGILALIGAPIGAMFLRSGVSQSREFAADEGGAEISGRPAALASALEKIQSVAQGVPIEGGNPGHAHLFIVNPFFGGGLAQFFSTHPPTEERVRRLRAMAGMPSEQ